MNPNQEQEIIYSMYFVGISVILIAMVLILEANTKSY